jgi:xanthine dehydrogenase YagS FAD-binding subunit
VIPFAYSRATDAPAAVAAVAADPGAAFLGGGTDLVDRLRLGLVEHALLVDVSRLPATVEALPGGGLRIGAAVRTTDLAVHPLLLTHYPVLVEALLSGASSPQRALATTAGNLLQRTRCVHFLDASAPCGKREPGSGCSAVGRHDRHHALLGASEHCTATHPSDLAVALVVLDAVVVVLGPEGERRVPVVALHRLPGAHPERDSVLAHGELVTHVELPPADAAARCSTYRKVHDRSAQAFSLVSVAAALEVTAGTVTAVRIGLGGVAPKPWRATLAESVALGAPATDSTFRAAAAAELAHAHVRAGSRYKIPMVTGTLVTVLRELARKQTGTGAE